MKKVIYTIGYSGYKKSSELTDILTWFNVNYLVDIRSTPFSRYNSQYNSVKLSDTLREKEIDYIHIPALGAKATGLNVFSKVKDIAKGLNLSDLPTHKRPDRAALREDDYIVDFNKYRAKTEFQDTVKKLRDACVEDDVVICLMCAEWSPLDCHRYFYVGKELTDKYGNELEVKHICKDNNGRQALLSQEEVDTTALEAVKQCMHLGQEESQEKVDAFLNLLHGWKK